MKILLIHARYQLQGGEDSVFEQERTLLSADNDVDSLVLDNIKGIGGLGLFVFSIWNLSAAKKIRTRIRSFQPDVIHIHNFHFAFGPIIIRTAKKANVNIIVTLHNYRILCPSGTLIHDQKLFLDSLNRSFPWKAIFNKVYRNSFILTLWLSIINWVHKKIGTWHMVDRFITLTNFERNIFISSTLAVKPGVFVVKPNFITPPECSGLIRQDRFLYVGRLSDEKGITLLLEAFKNNGEGIDIIGRGPLEAEVEAAVKKYDNIRYLGPLNKSEVMDAISRCNALIFPSIWYETFGLVIIEAFALGVPVIASNIGSASELIRHKFNGLHFSAGDYLSLNSSIAYWQSLSENEKLEYRQLARETYKTKFTPEINLEQLMNIYRDVR